MFNNDINYHVAYPDVYRPWSVTCEPFAGGDALLTKLRQGWEMTNETVYAEEHWHSGARLVMVYHFELIRNGEILHMPVVSNPFVRRMVRMEGFTVKPISERQIQRRRLHNSDTASVN
ncbi:MAG: hypothetical protein SF123_06640 [Chloroflexota bacterium]|nr:hypothetical protein [Chloroflexota bacterium]